MEDLQSEVRAASLKGNVAKTKSLCFFGTAYLLLWVFRLISLNLFLLLFIANAILLIITILERTHPNQIQTVRAVTYGIVPHVIYFYNPNYLLFATFEQFLSINFAFTEIPYCKAPALFISNALGWILAYIHFKYQLANGNPDMEQIRNMMDNYYLLPQFLLAYAINIGIISNMSAAKQGETQTQNAYQAKLLHLNKELEQANTKLQKSNEELQGALQEKEDFILRFSHEIRNPLNSLLGNVELCYDMTADNKELNAMLNDAKISGEILLQLLNNVLDTAKVSAGRLEITVSSQSFRGFLENSWEICSEIIRKKNLFGCMSVNVDVPDHLEFDNHRMMQILINMISNAVKFTDHGHVKLFVDFISGNEIESEEMRAKYFSTVEEEDENQAAFEELNEKPDKIFEHLTLKDKRFSLDRESIISNYREVVDVRTTFRTSSLTARTEIVTTKSETVPTRLKESPKKFSSTRSKFGNGYIRFEIIDSGCGMSKKELEAAFGKFQQVNTSSSKRQIGTGLGLWITKEIIELMKGKIKISSQPGKGTAVVIMLQSKSINPARSEDPVRAKLNTFDSRSYNAEEKKKQVKRQSQRFPTLQKALVVEDIPYNQEINKKLLQKCDVKDIIIASNGKEAVDIYLKMGPEYFGLILMDIDMPVMDGKTAVKIIRREEKTRGWPHSNIIFLTAFAEARTQQELLNPQGEYRANAFYSKPASLETIKRLIRKLTIETFSPSFTEIAPVETVSRHSAKTYNFIPFDDADKQFILIADDDSFNLTMVTKMVKLSGYRSLEARNGDEAVKLFEEHWRNIKFILMDCEMPILDGLEATKKIVASQEGSMRRSDRKIHIYGLTGHVGAEYRQKCLNSGMEDVLEKPIKFEELKALLAKDGSN